MCYPSPFQLVMKGVPVLSLKPLITPSFVYVTVNITLPQNTVIWGA